MSIEEFFDFLQKNNENFKDKTEIIELTKSENFNFDDSEYKLYDAIIKNNNKTRLCNFLIASKGDSFIFLEDSNSKTFPPLSLYRYKIIDGEISFVGSMSFFSKNTSFVELEDDFLDYYTSNFDILFSKTNKYRIKNLINPKKER